jgi:Protein of unknown function (DUF3606)
MADTKFNRGEPDRSKASGDQDYEVGYLARRHGLTEKQARALIDRVGNNRAKLDTEAMKLKQRRTG